MFSLKFDKYNFLFKLNTMFVPHTRAALRHMLANRQGGIMTVKSRIDSIETMSNEEVLQYAETLLI